MTTCPKCGHVRTESEASFPADQCPACGVYYDKALKVKLLREQEAQKKQAEPEAKPQGSAFGAFKADDKHAQANPAPQREDKPRTSICDDCGGVVSLSAKKCPHCGAKVRRPESRAFNLFVGFFIVFLIIYLIIKAIFGKPEPERIMNAQNIASSSGYHSCVEAVRSRLKSPSSANFPWSSDKVIDLGNNTFMVLGHVDAQNGFGVMLNTNFSCKVRVDVAAKKYSLEEVNVN